MKKIYTLLSLFTATIAVSQPILTSPNMQGPGITMVTKGLNAPQGCEGSAGINQNWDFSNFPYNNEESTSNWVAPGSIPAGTNFPGSTLAKSSTTPDADITDFYSNTPSAFNMHGTSISVSGTIINIVYNNLKSDLSFPVEFGSTFSDTYRGTGALSQPPILDIDVINSGSLSYEVDGYGTLTTFTGIYDNVIRLKYRTILNDTTTSTFQGLPPDVQTTTTRSTSYRWIQVTNNSSYVLMDVSYDTTVVAGEPDAIEFFVNHTYPSTLTSASRLNNNELSFYPNPTNGIFNLSMASNQTEVKNINVFDISGKIVKSFSLEVGKALSTHQLDISDLNAGAYFVSINGSSEVKNFKIIKN